MEASPFASLVTEQQIPKVFAAIERAVLASFEAETHAGRIILVHAVRRISRSEQKRRVGLCIAMFRELRGDLKWSLERIADHLPKFLRLELDGTSWREQATSLSRSWIQPTP